MEQLSKKSNWIQLTENNELKYIQIKFIKGAASLSIDGITFQFTSYEIIDDHIVFKIDEIIVFVIKSRNANSMYCIMIDKKKVSRVTVIY